MSDTKVKGVMSALKGRKGFASKKGVDLLAMVKKLTKKRKEMKGDGSGGCGKADGSGGPGWDKVKSIGKSALGGAKNLGWKAMDVVERGKLAPNEIPMQHQPDFVKKSHLNNFPKVLASRVMAGVSAPGLVTKSIIDKVVKKAKAK